MLQLGFDSLYFARIDYQDRAKRKDDKSLEVVWRGSKSLGSSSQVVIRNIYYLFFALIGLTVVRIECFCLVEHDYDLGFTKSKEATKI